jgi:hypothetical protein
MQTVMHSTAKRLLFIGGATLVVLGIWVPSIQHYRATRWMASGSPAGLQKAIGIEPANADAQYYLGRIYLFSEQDAERALPYLREAAHLQPQSARHWLDLAAADQMTGNQSSYRADIAQAVWADPKTPDVAWEAANLYLADGDIDKSLPYFRTAIENADDGAPGAFDLVWRSTHNVDLMLDRLLPPMVVPHLRLLTTLSRANEYQAATRVWNAILQLGQPIPARWSFVYIDYLLREKHPEEAFAAWRHLADYSSAMNTAESVNDVPLTNPSFEDEILNNGFDWHIEPPSSVSITTDDSEFHTGSQSLSLAISGPFQFAGVSQPAVVQPGADYVFSIYERSHELMSASGPLFVVEDAYDHQIIASGKELTGNVAWREERVAFTVPAKTHLVTFRLIRLEPDRQIHGHMWLDDARLTRQVH